MNAPAFPSVTLRDELQDLAHRVRRLVPDHRRPEQFFEEKDEIAHRLQALAAGAAPRSIPLPSRPASPAPRMVVRVVHVPMPRRYLRAPTRHGYPRPPRLPETVQPTLLLVPDHG